MSPRRPSDEGPELIVHVHEDEDDGGFLASMPQRPGAVGQGGTPAAAITNLASAITVVGRGRCAFCDCTRYRPLPDDAELCACDHVDDEHEGVGAMIRRMGEAARAVLLQQMTEETVAADRALDDGDVGTYEVGRLEPKEKPDKEHSSDDEVPGNVNALFDDDMPDCEVCLQPTIDPVAVAFKTPDVDCTILYCRDCLTDVFQRMAARYNAAIERDNRTVAAMRRLFGIDQTDADEHG